MASPNVTTYTTAKCSGKLTILANCHPMHTHKNSAEKEKVFDKNIFPYCNECIVEETDNRE